MADNPYSVADLLPHAPPMILLQQIIGFGPASCSASLTITPCSRFFVLGKGVPSYAGLEYMAQTCGLFVGHLARSNDLPVRVGYLLGTRNFHSETGWFQDGQQLLVDVTEILHDDPMAVFDCQISDPKGILATARLNVYQPPQTETSSRGEPRR